MKATFAPVAGLLFLGGCTVVDGGIATGIETILSVKDKVEERTIEGTVVGAKHWCRTIPLDKRLEARDAFAAKADADPTTAGMRVVVTCPQDAE